MTDIKVALPNTLDLMLMTSSRYSEVKEMVKEYGALCYEAGRLKVVEALARVESSPRVSGIDVGINEAIRRLEEHFGKVYEQESFFCADDETCTALRDIMKNVKDDISFLKQSLAQPAQAAIPAGWAIVPEYVNEEMAEAIYRHTWPDTSGGRSGAQQAWDNAIAVAPKLNAAPESGEGSE